MNLVVYRLLKMNPRMPNETYEMSSGEDISKKDVFRLERTNFCSVYGMLLELLRFWL